MVVAETVDQAKDAAELIEITHEPLPAVVRAADAVKPRAPRLWEDARLEQATSTARRNIDGTEAGTEPADWRQPVDASDQCVY
jgi:carbon-monoxide dehydrogenase large subunit